jgi:hypothetical protein
MNIANLALIAGSKWQWTESFTNFPAASYSARVVLKKDALEPVTIDAAASDIFTFTKTSSETASLTPGRYFFQYIFNDGTDDIILREFSGMVDVQPNINLTASDMRSQDEKDLEYLRSQFTKLSQKEVSAVSYSNRTYTYNDLEKIQKVILKLEYRVGQAAAKQKGFTRKKLVVLNKTF